MKHKTGRIELICGSMFCGKTEELIRRIRRAEIARQCVSVFKPEIDNRYSTNHVQSHSGVRINAMPLTSASHIKANLDTQTTVVAIDEVQFFDEAILDVVSDLADMGIRVILAGLDTDFRGVPFGFVPDLMCISEDVTKLHAICVICGEDACRTQRIINGKPAHYNDPVILVGAKESYEARCRKHHEVPGK